jgi:Holliday junction resolvase RusA-like endonuclease
MLPQVEAQLRVHGREAADTRRYSVILTIIEGRKRPRRDIDSYAKAILDTIKYSKLLWRDDEQVDDLRITRRKESRSDTEVIVLIEPTTADQP